MRWALPDRVFFACGACHILAYAFLARWGRPALRAIWIKPAGPIGNHVFIDGGDWVFDYHGYSAKPRFVEHTWRGARRRWGAEWDAILVELPADVLISDQKSRTYDGLWLREPTQFLHDAMPRAKAYLARFGPPPISLATSSGRHSTATCRPSS
jgi:hypothetical protein